jgi:hypothetical protein
MAHAARMRIASGRRNDQIGERRTDSLLARPSEERLRRSVPFENTAVLVDSHERIERRLDDAASALRTLLEHRFGAVPLGDISSDDQRRLCPLEINVMRLNFYLDKLA